MFTLGWFFKGEFMVECDFFLQVVFDGFVLVLGDKAFKY